MHDVEDRLNRALSERFDPVKAPPLPTEVLRRADRRHLGSLAGAAVITAIVAAIFVAALVSLAPLARHKIEPAAQGSVPGTDWIFFTQTQDVDGVEASLLFAVRTDGTGLRQISPDRAYAEGHIDFGASLSPDGTRLAYATSTGSRRSIVIATRYGRPLDEIPVDVADVSSPPVWSPDGSTIAFSGDSIDSSNDGINLMTYDVITGRLREVTTGDTQWDGMVWSSDGSALIAIHDYRPDGVSIERVPLDHPERSTVLWEEAPPPEGPGGVASWPVIASGVLSPDGTQVLHVDDRSDLTRFQITDLATGATKPVPLGQDGLWAQGWSPDGKSLLLYGPANGDSQGLWTAGTDGSNLERVPGSIRAPMNGVGVWPTWEFEPERIDQGLEAPDNSGSSKAVGTIDEHGRTMIATGHASFGDWNVSMGQGEFCFTAEDSSCSPTQHLESWNITTTSFNLTQSSGEPIMGQVGSQAASVRIEAFDGKTFDATIVDPPAGSPQTSRVFVAVLDGYGDGGDYTVVAYDANGNQVGGTSAGGNPMATKYLGTSPAPSSDAESRATLQKALAAAQSFHDANRTYVGFTPEQAAGIEPSLTWSTRQESAVGIVVIRQTTQDSVLLTVADYSWGRCIASSPAGVVEANIAAETVEGCSQLYGHDLLAQSHLRESLAAAESYYKDKGSFAGLDAGVLGSMGAVDYLAFTDRPTNDGMIVVRDVSDNTLLLVESLDKGSYFCIGQIAKGPDAGTHYGITDAPTVADCNDGPASWNT